MQTLRRGAAVVPAWRPAGEPLVEAKDVHVALGGTPVLEGVDVHVRAGRMVALVGPNGAGKSTLLGVLSGDVRPDSGWVLVRGKRISEWPVAELALAQSLLPQHPVVSFGFSVEAVVRMARAPWSKTSECRHDDEVVAAAMADADIAGFVSRRFPSLSGGEKARASVARVLAQCTQTLLLDEPTAALDVHHTEVVFDALQRRVEAGAAVVVVLHDLQLAAAHADTVILLSKGKVAAQGTPAEVLAPEVLSPVYGHEIDVIAHPDGGAPLVVPRRRHQPVPPGGFTGTFSPASVQISERQQTQKRRRS